MPEASGCIAVIGDVHSAWSREDVTYFNRSQYPLLLVTGDLGGSEARDGLTVARHMAELSSRTLVMPGNNDVPEYARIAAELTYRQGRGALLRNLDDDEDEVGVTTIGTPQTGVRTCGYSLHPLRLGTLDVTIIAARPFAMGGGEISFPDELEQSFGIRTLEQSSDKLCMLVDEAPSEKIIFFAHNGPFGFGGRPDDLWGRDFHPDAGDWGDQDLRTALDHAQGRVLAVIAGHMHWRLRTGGQRRWQLRDDAGVLYVNAARVPRITRRDGAAVHSHIALEVTAKRAEAHEIEVASEREGGAY
ncbi:MAG TPA: metallophosphoesterase [Polyangiales bacterium]|nr:metallophosphoesterase [Polyangiales bacterium]